MFFKDKQAKDVKIAYIGGGSKGWAWGLMSDLVANEDMSGSVDLYDIDFDAAKSNEIIGNKYNSLDAAKSYWKYRAVETLEEALIDANFVVISILPGTFDEMESDVHTPEKYGIYQSVGDTTGPGGIIRALRTLPMIEKIARGIEKYCPEAWVINYTNPMTLSVASLYHTFPKIKAFGCCHEVFGTQNLLKIALKEMRGIEAEDRSEIKVNVIGMNHFTWITEAQYKHIDLFPVYAEFCEKYHETGYVEVVDDNWMNNYFATAECVKMDLFRRYGYIAAAGDRHLAEFCPGQWYMENKEQVKNWNFNLTPVAWRKDNLQERLQKSHDLVTGKKDVEIQNTGEEGVNQMRALLGLTNLITNVNLPNSGQIPNLPLGAVVETNAVFRTNSLMPVHAGEIPMEIYALIAPICGEQQMILKAVAERNLDLAFKAFIMDRLVRTNLKDSQELFEEMITNTIKYLSMYPVRKTN